MLTKNEIWKIQDAIKYRSIKFSVGEEVTLFSKRKDGYPKFLEIGDVGVVLGIELNHISVDFSQKVPIRDHRFNYRDIKVPKKYFCTLSLLREFKLNKLFDEKQDKEAS